MSDQPRFPRDSTLGVTVYLRKPPTRDRLELVFDDTELDESAPEPVWRTECLYTYQPVEEKQIDDLSFTDDELIEIARTLIVRLHAFRKVHGE